MREIWPGRVHRWIIKAPHIRCPTELAYVSFLRVAKSNHMQVVTDGYSLQQIRLSEEVGMI